VSIHKEKNAMKILKSLALALMLTAFWVPTEAQKVNPYEPILSYSFPSITATGAQSAIYERGKSYGFHTLTVKAVSGTNTTCTVAVDSSADGVTYTAGGALAGVTCTSDVKFFFDGVFNYLRVNVTALSGAGNTIAVSLKSYDDTNSPVDSLCRSSATPVAISTAAASTLSIVAPVTGGRIHLCGYFLNGAGATTYKFQYGTGATCGTGTTDLMGAATLAAGTTVAAAGTGVTTPISQRLCGVNSAAVQVSGYVTVIQGGAQLSQ
jgi:hypothetical protein